MIRALAALVLLASAPALANTAETPEVPKKQRFLEAKIAAQVGQSAKEREQWEATLDKRIGKQPEPVINIYNTWTQEFLAVSGDPKSTETPPRVCVDEFLRCHFANQPTEMDPRLLQALLKAARHFKSQRIDIVSGFRSPKFNLILRKKGHEVARQSQHTLGHAVDFRLRGVATTALHKWARSLRMGGVGFYPNSAFVHIDVGPVRYWTGR